MTNIANLIRLDIEKPNQIPFLETGVEMNRMRRILLVCLCFLSSLTGVFAQEVLLGATGGAATGTLYRIDPRTGTATGIGLLVDGSGHSYAVTGLAFDNVTGILYGSTSNNSPTGSRSLVAIDPLTGAVTPIGSFAISGTMADLTFDITTTTLYGTGSLDGTSILSMWPPGSLQPLAAPVFRQALP
jgi:hypothetical protein